MKASTQPIVTISWEVAPLAFHGGLARILRATDDTDGAFSMVHLTQGHGIATPLHIHHTSDEAFFVLAGEARGVCGDEEWAAGPGSFVWLPRGVPHAFQTVSTRPLELLAMSIPGAFDKFVVATSQPYVEDMDLAAAKLAPDALAAIAAEHDIDSIGPPINFL